MSSSRPRSGLLAGRLLFALLLLLSVLPAPDVAFSQAPDCQAETEPNNTEAEVQAVEGAFCIAGDLPEVADQDLFLWTVSDEDAKFIWTMTVAGPVGVVTSAKLLTLSSEPGVDPIVAGTQIAEVGTTPESDAPVSSSFLMTPGRYLVGISRTDSTTGPPLTTTYELALAQSSRLPKRLDDEPNDAADTASPVSGAFETAGDALETIDTYAWTLTEDEAALGWELHVQVALGQSINLTVTTDPLAPYLVSTGSNQQGRIDLYDLALEPGTYFLQLSPGATVSTPYLMTSNSAERPATDLEPNDQPASATPIDLANPVLKGRLAADNDTDMYLLTVDDEIAGSLFDLRLITRSQQNRQLCIGSEERGTDLQCKQGVGGAALSNISLPRGEYLIRVSGTADPDDQYLLRLDVTAAPAADFETEPNDTEELAATLDPAVPISGRFDGNETDTFRFTIEGEPQLWDVSVAGAGISQLDFTRRDGTELSTAEVAPEGLGARLSDLYLPPGEHWIRIGGVDGDYVITLTPLGPPPPDGERESNNQLVLAEPMLVGETKTGRLVEVTDTDYFRFSLAATEHIVLELASPQDGLVKYWVDWGQTRIAEGGSSEPGEAMTLDLTLEAGDYVVSLAASQVSTNRYSLTVNRGDPFAVSDDQEPNDTASTAQTLPFGGEMSGTVDEGDTVDTYAIAPGTDRDLTFVLESDGAYLSLTDGDTYYTLAQSADLTTWTIDQRVSDDLPLYLEVGGIGPYTVRYGPPAEDGPGPNLPGFLDGGDDAAVTLNATLAFDTTQIAAYWHEGQIVDGMLTLENESDGPVDFLLSSATSDFHFTVEIDDAPISIDAGQTLEVPVTVLVEPDAWADIPVQITVAAYVGDLPVSASAEITPTASAPPLNGYQAWPLPIDLRGGLDLTSPTLGAVVAGTVDPEGEALLHDGVAPIGSGLSVSGPFLPLALTVDLAGDAPAPIAGIVINPQTWSGLPQAQIRDFELLLSTDGVNFESVLTRRLSPIVREQWFVLGLPAEATHAQLMILSTYDSNPTAPSELSLGEWSVISTPGYVPETLTEIDIAAAANGGHVVRWSPQPYGPETGVAMLSPDVEGDPVQGFYPLESPACEWVIGFADNRAAMITELRWIDHVDTVEANRLSEVEIEVSTGTPSGPWESIGTWGLERQGDGSIAPFTLDEPTWARFVRFSGTLPEGATQLEYPEQLSIIEAPIGDDYLSVTGAWGATSSAGYFEVVNPPAGGELRDEQDAPDDQAQATELALDEPVSGRAQIGQDVDWYRVTAPDDDNTLTFTLTGAPTVDVVVRVYDEDGTEVSVAREVSGDTSTVAYTATVTPGAEYDVLVQQPPHSIVFAFDTSISMGPYQPLVQQSLRSFAAGVEEGQEFIQIIPFDEDPLLEDWTDDTYLVSAAINRYYGVASSSSAENGIIASTELLAGQEGTTAILIITDAETSSYGEGLKMWQQLDVTQPRIFAVHVGGSSTPVINEHLMQDWSSNGGYYQYTTNQAEMDRAFDRAATWLRRPTAYGLTVTSSFEEPATPTPEPTATSEPTPTAEPTATPEPTATLEPTEEPSEPGSLTVIGQEDGGDESAVVSDQVTIEIILDTSGSMLAAMPDGQRRIDVARTVLTDLVTNQLPAGVPVALRVFGTTPDSCETSLLMPPQPLDPATMAGVINQIEPVNLVKTPLGASLEQVANDLAGVEGPKIVVLVTDGEETCEGDPGAAIQSLVAQGIEVQVNIVGFALDDDALRAQFSEWAELGNGTYFDATNAEELDEAIAAAVQAPFRVLDADGNVVATGTVGGNPVELPAGTYTVVVLTDPEQRYEDVVIGGGEEVELQLDG